MHVSIIAPAHNEEDRIRPFLEAYCAYFAECREFTTEFILVVNNSSDGTEQVVREFSARYAFVKLIVEPNNVGKGGALLQGFAQATGDVIGFVDADGATPPVAFHDLVRHHKEADIIIASRWMKGSDVSPVQPLSRRVASRIFNRLVRVMFGFNITDTQCGAKLMHAEGLHKIRSCIGTTRWAFDVDLLFQCTRHGFSIMEIPTIWHDVTGSKVDVVRASTEMFIAMCRLRLLFSPFRFVVKVYDVTIGAWVVRREKRRQEQLRGN